MAPNSVPQFECRKHKSIDQVEERQDIIVFAVKPHQLKAVILQMKDSIHDVDTLFVSLAAGIKMKFYKKMLGEEARVSMVMTNI